MICRPFFLSLDIKLGDEPELVFGAVAVETDAASEEEEEQDSLWMTGGDLKG